MKPLKLSEPEILLEVLAEGGSLTLMTAEMLAWDDPKVAAVGYDDEYLAPTVQTRLPLRFGSLKRGGLTPTVT